MSGSNETLSQAELTQEEGEESSSLHPVEFVEAVEASGEDSFGILSRWRVLGMSHWEKAQTQDLLERIYSISGLLLLGWPVKVEPKQLVKRGSLLRLSPQNPALNKWQKKDAWMDKETPALNHVWTPIL